MSRPPRSWVDRADILTGARLLRALPTFLRHPVGSDEALGTVRRRLERRERDFLDVAARLIYGNPDSPYRPLLARAGCEYGDLAKLVVGEGVGGGGPARGRAPSTRCSGMGYMSPSKSSRVADPSCEGTRPFPSSRGVS
jgi:hypothetical protein